VFDGVLEVAPQNALALDGEHTARRTVATK
jgi:hypothetical protein